MLSLLLAVLAWLISSLAGAATAGETVSLRSLDRLLQQFGGDKTLDEKLRSQATTRLGEAKNWLQEAARLRQEKQALEQTIKEGSKGVERFHKKLARLKKERPVTAASLTRLSDRTLETRLSQAQLDFQEAKHALDEAEKSLSDFITAAKSGGERIAETRRKLEETDKALASLSTSGIDPRLMPVEQAWLQARRQRLKALLDYLTVRQTNLGLLTDVAQARRDLLAARLEQVQEKIDAYRQALQQRREEAAKKETQQARTATLEAPPELRRLQQEITRLLEEKQRLVAEEARVSNRLDAVRALLDELRADRDRITHLVAMGGRGETLSSILQKRLAALPSLSDLRQESLRLQKRLNDAILRQLELDEELRANEDLDAALARLLAALDGAREATPRERLRTKAREHLEQRRETVADLLKDNTRLISQISELVADLGQLQTLVAEFRSYLSEQLLWMPSTRALPLTNPAILFQGVQWHLHPRNLGILAGDLARAARDRPDIATLLLAAILALFALRGRLRRHLDSLGERTRSIRTDSWTASLLALIESAAIALPLPMVLAGTAILLRHGEAPAPTARFLCDGLLAAAQVLFALDFLRVLCRDQGLLQRHLRWLEAFRQLLRHELVWFLPLATLLAYLTATGGTGEGRPPEALALGRVAFIGLMAATLLFVWRLGRLGSPVTRALAAHKPASPWLRYHALWFPFVLLIPAALIVASLVGYYYSALYLAARVHLTLWSLIALYLARDLLLRALSLTQRRMRFEEAMRRREERRQAQAGGQEGDNLVVEEPEYDIHQLSAQVRQLVQTGYLIGILIVIWLIWSDVVPALRFLDTITLPITSSKLVDGVEREVPLTLGDLLSGLLLAGFTLLAGRNLPAVLELTLLQRLPLSRGAAYAIKAITQYTVALLGIVLIFSTLGLQWSSIQWLVAALGVGLGFGLQEIVANFVSGLILLFEQPIRVGDVVTVEGITGTVSRIRIRATTIVNWDRQELVIPNKAFITGQLINWTLSDTVNRVVITIGVAYGSDVERAMALLEEAAREHPMVLDEPAPRVTFEEFGDNALTLRLRAYLDDLDYRLTLITDLHRSINRKFEAAGIEIAFPQRDLHLDTRQPLEIVLRKEAGEQV